MTKNKFMGYNAESSSKLRCISQIFQKDNRNVFTDDSYLAQDILRYYFEVKDVNVKSFKLRQLQRWVVQNNREIKTYYSDKESSKHTTIGNRIHGFERRINRIFKDLIQMNLMKQEFLIPADKLKDKQVRIYSFTKMGELLALIIKGMNLKNELSAAEERNDSTAIQIKMEELGVNNQRLYNLVISMLAAGESAPYQATLLKIFLAKLSDRKLIAKFIDYVILVCNSNNHIDGIPLLVNHVLDYMLNEASDRNLFIDLLYESGNEIDPNGKYIFLYERKLISKIDSKVILKVIQKNMKSNSLLIGQITIK